MSEQAAPNRRKSVVRVYCDSGHARRTVERFEPDPGAAGWWRPVVKNASPDRDDAVRDTSDMSPFGLWGDRMVAWRIGVQSVNDIPATQQFLTGDRPGGETEEQVRAGVIPSQRQRFNLRCPAGCPTTVPMTHEHLNDVMQRLVGNGLTQVRLCDLGSLHLA